MLPPPTVTQSSAETQSIPNSGKRSLLSAASRRPSYSKAPAVAVPKPFNPRPTQRTTTARLQLPLRRPLKAPLPTGRFDHPTGREVGSCGAYFASSSGVQEKRWETAASVPSLNWTRPFVIQLPVGQLAERKLRFSPL